MVQKHNQTKNDFLSQPWLVLLGEIKVKNNNYQTHLVEWNSLTPRLTICVVKINVNRWSFYPEPSDSLSPLSHLQGLKCIWNELLNQILNYKDYKSRKRKVWGWKGTFHPILHWPQVSPCLTTLILFNEFVFS